MKISPDHKLPCDVQIGHITFRKGVAVATLAAAAASWFEISRHSVLNETQRATIRRRKIEEYGAAI